MSFCANAAVANASITAVAPAKSLKLLNMVILLQYCPRSVRERPDPEIAPDVAPEPVEAFRLEHQKHDDKPAEDDQAQVRDQIVDVGVAEQVGAPARHAQPDRDRQQRDEDGAEDRAEDRAQAAD